MSKLYGVPDEIYWTLKKELHLTDEEIQSASPKQNFISYCQWHGLINWGETLWDLVKASG